MLRKELILLFMHPFIKKTDIYKYIFYYKIIFILVCNSYELLYKEIFD